MQAPWREGDTGATTCTVCGKQVRTRFEKRDIQLNRSRVVFSNVLVGVCGECNAMISLPRQSFAQLRELGSWK